MPTRARRDAVMAVVACLLVGGCSVTAGLAPTQPSGTTQQLMIRALERSLAGLDLSRLSGRTVEADVYAQAGNQSFVKEFVVAWLKGHGVPVLPESAGARGG